MTSDLKDILAFLNRHKVKFVIIGGYAVIKYTEPRYTKDIDILIEASPANSKRLYKALVEFGAPVDNLSPTDFAKVGTMYFMGMAPNRVDFLTRVKGAKFENIYKNSAPGKLFNQTVRFISRSDLIKTKKAAARPQDLLDLENLKKYKY